MKEYIVNAEQISRTYKMGQLEVEAVRSIDLNLEKGKFISLVGHSGCGKSTTLNMLGTIDKPDAGSIKIDGKDVGKMNDNTLTEFRARNIGFIFQSFNLIPVLNVEENIAYPLQLQGIVRSEIKTRTQQMIEEVGLSEWSLHKPNEISGGQQQRVAIARALIIEPKLVIADEPTANLDSKTTFRIMDLMKKLQQEFHTTFLFATHDTRFVDYMDICFEMEDGKIINQKDLK